MTKFLIPYKTKKPNPSAGNTVYYQNIGNGEYQTLYTLSPEPPFLYEYGDYNVKCENCREVFDWKNLDDDDIDWIDEDGFEAYADTDTKCPKCGTWNCCVLEFEK